MLHRTSSCLPNTTSPTGEHLPPIHHEPGALKLGSRAGGAGLEEERPELLVEPALHRAEDVHNTDASAPKVAATADQEVRLLQSGNGYVDSADAGLVAHPTCIRDVQAGAGVPELRESVKE
jgi:hypothetical protein